LQELKATDTEFPAEAIKDAGYEAIWRGQKTWSGVAILSKCGSEWDHRRIALRAQREPAARPKI
jgi:exodeoxyribonuclease-3